MADPRDHFQLGSCILGETATIQKANTVKEKPNKEPTVTGLPDIRCKRACVRPASL